MIDLRLPAIVSVPTIHETHRRLLYSPQPTLARSFLAGIYDGSVNIVVTNPVDEYEATKLIDRYAGLALTLTDATNMALMVRIQIGAAFSFDRHFLQAGFVRVPPLHL
jgi:predicted nucleic acid-binding protein